MRRTIGYISLAALLSLSLSYPAEPVKRTTYRSEKPLYAKFILNEAGSKVLTLAFDESAGTGKGYDTIYADLNLNGDLTDDKAIKGTLQRRGGSSLSCSFSPFVVDVPYNEMSKGVEKPWEIAVGLHEDRQSRLFGLVRGELQRRLFIGPKMHLKDESGEWQYSFSIWTQPAETLAAASPIALRGKPMLWVETKPDPQKKGNTGIAAYLRLDVQMFQCLKAGQPLKAHVLVKDDQGNTVHSDDVGLEKLFFG